MSVERRFISPLMASQYLGCHVQTVYIWIARGEIPSTRLGRKVLVDKRRLDAMLEAQVGTTGNARQS